MAIALLTACGSEKAGVAPLNPFEGDGGGPPTVTPGGGEDGGPSPGGDEKFDADAVWVAVTSATGNSGFLDSTTLKAGRTIVRGTAEAGWITTDGRLIYELGERALELVCDTPCSIQMDDAALSTDPLDNDAPVAALTCGHLVLSREDEVWNSCGQRLWTARDDEVKPATGELLAIHDDRIALVASETRLSLQDLNSGELTALDDSELHAHAADLAPGLVRTTDDGFWVLVSAAADGEEAVRFTVSLSGGIIKDGTYRTLEIPQTRWPLGPGTLAADGSMYKILHYDNLDTGFSNDALIRIDLDVEPTVGDNILIDTGPLEEFGSLDALVTGP